MTAAVSLNFARNSSVTLSNLQLEDVDDMLHTCVFVVGVVCSLMQLFACLSCMEGGEVGEGVVLSLDVRLVSSFLT